MHKNKYAEEKEIFMKKDKASAGKSRREEWTLRTT